jgi:hypothetical protein
MRNLDAIRSLGSRRDDDENDDGGASDARRLRPSSRK